MKHQLQHVDLMVSLTMIIIEYDFNSIGRMMLNTFLEIDYLNFDYNYMKYTQEELDFAVAVANKE